jgi:hypothetical protein
VKLHLQLVDIFTKPLGCVLFHSLFSKMNILDIFHLEGKYQTIKQTVIKQQDASKAKSECKTKQATIKGTV